MTRKTLGSTRKLLRHRAWPGMLPAMSKEPDAEDSRSEDAEEERSGEAAGGSGKAGSSGSRRRADLDEKDAEDDEDDQDDEDDEDEDDQDQDEDDQDQDEDEEDEEVRPARRRPPVRPQAKRPPPVHLTEKQINSPEPQTLVMLGLVALMTLILWGMARFACNAHPPQPVKPRQVSTEQLAGDPKDAAIELQQRWATKHYSEALELATGKAAAELEKDEKACEANKKACAAESKKLAGQVLTTGVVLSREPAGAVVQVTSTGGPKGKQSYVMHLRANGLVWKADSRRPGTGAVPAAAAVKSAPPAGSAAPAASAR